MPGSNKYSTYQGVFGKEPDLPAKELLTPSIKLEAPTRENDDLRNIKSFKLAFRIARQRGLKTFKWGASKYTTELKKDPPVLKTSSKKEESTSDDNSKDSNSKGNISKGSRNTMTEEYVADMLKRGFELDHVKQMWYKLKKPIVEAGKPKPIGVLRTRYYQQGGNIDMDDPQLLQDFIQFLMEMTGAQNQDELQDIVLSLGEEGVQQAYKEFLKTRVSIAKFGAKLDYIKSLRGVCPEGYDLQYYKQGGRLCKQCIKKQTNVMNEERDIPTNPIDAFKCGNRMRKKKK